MAKTMRIQATKTMAKLLQQKFPKYTIDKIQMTDREYKWYVDSSKWWGNCDDYDFDTNKFNVIVVEYPAEYYACNNYLTTEILVKLFKASDKTLEGFIKEVKNELEI